MCVFNLNFINLFNARSPIHHHLKLLAALIELSKLSALLGQRRVVIQLAVAFTRIARSACCYVIDHFIAAALAHGVNVVNLKNHIGRAFAAILTLERITLKHLKACFFGNCFSFEFHSSSDRTPAKMPLAGQAGISLFGSYPSHRTKIEQALDHLNDCLLCDQLNNAALTAIGISDAYHLTQAASGDQFADAAADGLGHDLDAVAVHVAPHVGVVHAGGAHGPQGADRVKNLVLSLGQLGDCHRRPNVTRMTEAGISSRKVRVHELLHQKEAQADMADCRAVVGVWAGV
jgi:hypothetical protein